MAALDVVSALIQIALWTICMALPFTRAQQLVLAPNPFSAGGIVDALRKAEVIPDVLPDHFRPKLAVRLAYDRSRQAVDLGNEIGLDKTKIEPSLRLQILHKPEFPTPTHSSRTTYTLVLSDPDATSRAEPTKGQMCHWILTGITSGKGFELKRVGSEDGLSQIMKEIELNDLNEILSYLPPAPPEKTGRHRYVFVLLEPKTPEDSDRNLTRPVNRPHFGFEHVGQGVMDWANVNHLTPVGANFFYAANEIQ